MLQLVELGESKLVALVIGVQHEAVFAVTLNHSFICNAVWYKCVKANHLVQLFLEFSYFCMVDLLPALFGSSEFYFVSFREPTF